MTALLDVSGLSAYYGRTQSLFDINLAIDRIRHAGGNPLVHIRAIPEGGPAGTQTTTNLPYTFYDRFTAPGLRTVDRRQPLPSTFAARFISGTGSAFNTAFKIWREPSTGGGASCDQYGIHNSGMSFVEAVRFDEHENPTTGSGGVIIDPPPPSLYQLSVTSAREIGDYVFPISSASGDVGGWLYLNLNNGGTPNYSVTSNGISSSTPPTPRDFVQNSSTIRGPRQSQNWVIVSMTAEGRYSVDFDATPLANGCTPSPALGAEIAPGPNVTP